jgi:hypothetical protein
MSFIRPFLFSLYFFAEPPRPRAILLAGLPKAR